MTPQEFIITRLNEIVFLFPSFIFKYKFQPNEKIHLIEVEPLSEFQHNMEYLDAEADLVFEFENTFLTENILFVSEESINRVENPDMIISYSNIGLFIDNLINAPYFTTYKYMPILNTIEIHTDNYSLAA